MASSKVVSKNCNLAKLSSDSALGNAFRDLKDIKLYPSVGAKRPGAHLRVNFGQSPFIFDIDGMVAVRSFTSEFLCD